MMAKTPEDVKRGLSACKTNGGCVICPYHCLSSGAKCIPAMADDAFAYIEHLESRLAQTEREKQALLHDMKHVAPVEICEACAHSKSESKCEENDFNCDKCPEDCPCKTCRDCRENFQWRGICADNTKEETNEN